MVLSNHSKAAQKRYADGDHFGFKKGGIPWNVGTHFSLGKKLSLETRQKLSDAQKRVWSDPEYKKRMSEHRKYICNTPEGHKRLSKFAKLGWERLSESRKAEICKKESDGQKRHYVLHPERKLQISNFMRQRNLKNWSNLKFRERMSEAQVKTWTKDDVRRRRSVGISRGLNQSKLFHAVMSSQESRSKKSKSHKALWKDPEFFKWKFERYQVKPNASELKLNGLLQEVFPNQYQYVGDGFFILGGKCPDFMNVNGQKKLIELFGNYWHQNDDSNRRIAHFGHFGYETLVVWESELKDKDLLMQKLVEFNG